MITTGYIIQSENRQYLDRFFNWRPHSSPAKGYVHTAQELRMWGGSEANWPNEAQTVFVASYDTEGGGFARLTDLTMPFSEFSTQIERLAEAESTLGIATRRVTTTALGGKAIVQVGETPDCEDGGILRL
jgi:hypothetical protein